MATKKKRRVTKTKRNPLLDRLPKTPEAYLELLIRVSEKSVTGQGTSIDEFFTEQAGRLRKQLETLRKSK